MSPPHPTNIVSPPHPTNRRSNSVAKHTKNPSCWVANRVVGGPSPAESYPPTIIFTMQRCLKDAVNIATQRLGMNLQTCCSPLGWCLLPRALLLFAPSSAQFSRITVGSELSMEGSTATHLGNVSIKSLPAQQTIFQENCKK